MKTEEPKTPEEFKKFVDGLLIYINDTPSLLSLLYDLDLMPEQVKEGSPDWKRMIIVASWHHKNQPDIIADYQGKDGHRDWWSGGTWLMPGQAVAVVEET